jgi:uncharacterized protein YdeI (YjbR/CyaY-like superfamily)
MKRKAATKSTLYVASRREWRAWLKKHYKSEPEVWLVYFKKHSGKPRIPYNDAVEGPLCFGWIDSTVKSLDEDRFTQRFSPRNPKSGYSQANKERLRALAKQRKLTPEVLASVQDIISQDDKFRVPADIIAAIRESPDAWANFKGFSPAYVRIRISFIEAARNRPEEFKKRLRYFIQMTEKGRQFGFGGIEKHY